MRRFPYFPITKAARLKRISRKTLWVHARRGSFDVVRVGGATLIVDNQRWRNWEPDRKRQRAILRGLRAREGLS
jgi:hypothetical protein